eukprot:m.117018 g.117018  ORF g.117018 m.117018 type:complete len:58 (-) comp14477_c0_seq5:18-191(-)
MTDLSLFSFPQEIEPQFVAWRGASIAAVLASAEVSPRSEMLSFFSFASAHFSAHSFK